MEGAEQAGEARKLEEKINSKLKTFSHLLPLSLLSPRQAAAIPGKELTAIAFLKLIEHSQ